MTRHLVLTVEEFNREVEREHGPDAHLHPSNRMTACGRHAGSLDTTTTAARATCKVCTRRSA